MDKGNRYGIKNMAFGRKQKALLLLTEALFKFYKNF
jgi:hypothetical protein